MNKQSLLDMLNIKPVDVKTQAVQPSKQATVACKESSRHVLQLDEWDMAQGGKLLRHNHYLRSTKLEPDAVSDLFNLVYVSTPKQQESPCVDQRRSDFITETLESPNYQALHRSTELNPVASEIATVELAKGLTRLKEEDSKREVKAKEAQAKGKRVDPSKEAGKAELACLSAVAGALKKADKEVEELQETMTALGCGHGVGNTGQLDVGKIASTFQRVKDSSFLRNVINKTGRCRRYSQAQQRRKTHHGYDDVVGVILDGDVGRLLPHELAMLATPELELDSLRRLVERQSMCRQYKGVEKIGKGPIVMCVDESGSMSGDNIEWAKAIALTMGWVARYQNRWLCLCGYSGGTEGTRLILPPKKWDESALMDWLVHFFSGGTDLDVPLDVLPRVWWPEFVNQGMKRGRTDLILVTDALCSLPESIEKSFLAWKQAEKVKCISLVLGADAGDLKKVSDEVYEISHLDLNQDAVQRCLSI